MRFKESIRYALLIVIVFLLWLIVSESYEKRKLQILAATGHARSPVSNQTGNKCGLPNPCPAGHFAFYLKTGVANVVGPKICFDGRVIMSGAHNNIGHGLNIVVVDAATGEVEKYDYFNMYSESVDHLVKFLKDLKEGMLVLVATFDDPATKMTDEVRELFTHLGSSHVNLLKFRDSWLFAGATGISQKSPFETVVHNDEKTNFFNGWPSALDLGGCFPQKFER
ncbi:protein FAM3C-like [Scleropages formosus]|uniref:FAM3 metabolism regulating signaling molecule D n=1 Tax=Scleropages formosus TaxID=113540 RepID=A0A8C9SAV1_SCLFO|nr:protein FAM3D [Scleropages formosus]